MPMVASYDGFIYEPICRYIFQEGQYPWPTIPDAIYIPQFAYVYEMRHILTLGSWIYMCYGDTNVLPVILAVSFLGITTLITLFSMSLRRNKRISSAILLPAFIVIISVSLQRAFTDFHNDVLFLFLWIVTSYSFLLLIEKNERKFLLLSGALLGFLLVTKAQALLFPIVIIAYLISELIFGERNLGWRVRYGSFRLIFGALIIGLAISSVYFVNNWVLNGNPVYPMLASNLGGDTWSAQFCKHRILQERGHGMFPFSIEYVLNRFLSFLNLGSFGGLESNRLIVSFCVLGFLILASNIRNKQDRFLLTNCVLVFLVWFFMANMGDRALMPSYAFSLIAFSGLTSLRTRTNQDIGWYRTKKYLQILKAQRVEKYFKVICILAILLPVSCTALKLIENDNYIANVIWEGGGKNIYSLGGGPAIYASTFGIYSAFEPNMHFLLLHFVDPPDIETVSKTKYGDFYQVGVFINSNLPENTTILTMEIRAFHFSERQMIWDGNKGINRIYLQEDLEEVLKIMKAYGITHILYREGRGFENMRTQRLGIEFRETSLIHHINDKEIFKIVWRGATGDGIWGFDRRGNVQLVLYEIDYPPSLR